MIELVDEESLPFLGNLALMIIFGGPIPLDDPTGVVTAGISPGTSPPVLAVPHLDAVLDIIGLAGDDGVPPDLEGSGAVVGVEALGPGAAEPGRAGPFHPSL